jgi:hypothetical protein
MVVSISVSSAARFAVVLMVRLRERKSISVHDICALKLVAIRQNAIEKIIVSFLQIKSGLAVFLEAPCSLGGFSNNRVLFAETQRLKDITKIIREPWMSSGYAATAM